MDRSLYASLRMLFCTSSTVHPAFLICTNQRQITESMSRHAEVHAASRKSRINQPHGSSRRADHDFSGHNGKTKPTPTPPNVKGQLLRQTKHHTLTLSTDKCTRERARTGCRVPRPKDITALHAPTHSTPEQNISRAKQRQKASQSSRA